MGDSHRMREQTQTRVSPLAGSKRSWRDRWGRLRREKGFPFLLTLPTLIAVLAVTFIPFFYSLAMSMHHIDMLTKRWIFVGLNNYLQILPDPEFLGALGRTTYFALITVTGGTVLGLVMALILNTTFRGRGLLRSVVLIPWAMSLVAVGVLWGWIYNGEYGPLNAALIQLGLIKKNIYWLTADRALNLVALAHVWRQAPLATLLFLAGLQSIPQTLYNAARIDGATPWQQFWHITLPWLKPMLLLALIISTIDAIMAFDLFWILTKGGPGSATTVFSWLGYALAFQFFKFGEGAAVLYILSLMCLILAFFYLRILFPRKKTRLSMKTESSRVKRAMPVYARRIDELNVQGLAGGQRTRSFVKPTLRKGLFSAMTTKRLGRIGLYTCAILIGLWSFLPFLWLIIMSLSRSVDLLHIPPKLLPWPLTLQNYQHILFPAKGLGGLETSVQAQRVPYSILNSLLVAGSVTLINLAIGAIAGYAYAAYQRFRFMRTTLWILMMTRMIPGLAIVIPFFILFRMAGLLDTKLALIISYTSFILPLTIWMMKGYFESVPPSLERAALVDGCTRLKALYKVILPVARPGIVAAGIFCFIVAWNEFIFALMLTGTPKAQTISVIISGFLVQARFQEFGSLFAASVVAVLPPIVVAFGFQKYLIQGMLSGSLKG